MSLLWPGWWATDAWYEAWKEAFAGAVILLEDWYNPEKAPEEVLDAMMVFYGLEGLNTDIFGYGFKRLLLALGTVLREHRGSELAIRRFSDVAIGGGNYRYVFRLGPNDRPEGIVFTVEPPTGLIPLADWQQYLKRAYLWLIPERLALDTFEIGISEQTDVWVYHADRPFIEARSSE